MGPQHEAAIDAVDAALAAAKRLREALRANEAAYRGARRSLEHGSDVAPAITAAKVGDARGELNEALDDFEQARHQSRIALIRVGLDQDMTIGDVSRAWGFSRQMAARYAKEARGEI